MILTFERIYNMKKSKYTGAADWLCVEAGGGWSTGRRGLQEDGHQQCTVLPTLYLKKKYGKLEPSESRRLRQLKEESGKVKRMMALSMDNGSECTDRRSSFGNAFS
jgi:hypothetical protein